MEKEYSISEIYGNDKSAIITQKIRYEKLKNKFSEVFGYKPYEFFSSPGRTEISGNHTDHNRGKVIAASINLDSIAAAAKHNEHIKIFSDGYESPFEVDLNKLEICKSESGTTTALIRGIAAGFKQKGYKIGGFEAFITSDVLQGSGLSSSASVEVLIGTILNHFYNNAEILPEEIAKISQFSENKYFMKPCGLMDQMACAVGGIIGIDFKETESPIVEKINFEFSRENYSLIIVHTGGSHFNLTEEYASIPEEMFSVAAHLGRDVCREINFQTYLENITELRNKVSDRALLRALHFFKENNRVAKQIEALKNSDFPLFLKYVKESGNSSFKWLQNIYSSSNVSCQNITLALAMTEEFIEINGAGACRIHGGGFEGTIQVFIPKTNVKDYQKFITGLFSDFKIYELSIRAIGAVKVTGI